MADRTDTFYPAEGAIHGYGSQLLVSDGAPTTPAWAAIAAVVKITPGEMGTEDIDRTHLRSPDAHREHMPGLRDSKAFVVEFIWMPAEESQSNAGGATGVFAEGGLIKMWRERTIHDFMIRLPVVAPAVTPVEWPFRGYVSKFQPGEIGAEDKIGGTAEFMPTQAYDADLP
jgi:hypothetical protein